MALPRTTPSSYTSMPSMNQPVPRHFWEKLKQEWLDQLGPFDNIEQVRLELFEYIDGYYYAKRLHQALDYRTPRDDEEESLRNH